MNQINAIPGRSKLISVMIFIGLVVALSVCMGLWHWYLLFAPALALYACEHSAGMVKRIGMPVDEGVGEDVAAPADIRITSISQWILKDFMQCVYYDNYESIGRGTPEQIRDAYNDLLSQYYEARNDEQMRRYIMLRLDIIGIESRMARVLLNTCILKERYSEAAAEALRGVQPCYLYTEESYLRDVGMLLTAEIATGIKHERLCRQLEELDKQHSGRQLSAEQRINGMIRGLMDIRKNEGGVNYDINTMTVLEYAIAENRLQEHIEYLQEQAKKSM